jgi:hypothetical protein
MFGPGAVLDSFQSSGAAPKLLRGAITYAAGSTGAIGSTTLFTVTGDVAIYFLGAKCTTDLTSAGAPTWTIGVTGTTDINGATFPDVTGWDTGEWAQANGPGYSAGGDGTANLFGNNAVPVTVSANIIQTIASATITGGVVRWYLQYVPLSGDGLVTLHANLTAF